MSKITLNNVGSLVDTTTAQTTINANNATIQTAIDNTLSRDGTSPNTMSAPLDMNNHQVINLPAPATTHSPLRLSDLNSFIGGGTISSLPAGGTTGQVLGKASNTDYDTAWQTKVISVAQAAPGDFTVTGSPVTSSGTLTLGWATPPLGSGAMARTTNTTLTTPTINTPTITTPTITSPQVTGPLNVTSGSATSVTVGANGTTNPTLTVDSSIASQVAGLRIKGAVTAGAVSLDVLDPGANSSLTLSGKGAGTVSLANASTGGIFLNNAVTLSSTINKVNLTAPATAATLTIANNKTLTANNSLTFAGTDGTTQTFQATDTIVGRATTDTLTNKTLTSPVLTTPSLGVATATTINGAALDNLAWTTYSPTITASAGTFTSITSVVAASKQIGKTFFLRVSFTITTVGTASGSIIVPYPGGITNNGITFVGGQEAGSKKNLGGQAGNGGNTLTVNFYDGTSAIGAGNTIFLEGCFEVN